MQYADAFVVPVPKENLRAYRRIAQMAGNIWCEHGALEYREYVGDHSNAEWGVPFPRNMELKHGETVVVAWIIFKSRAHRDEVNAQAMNDPRLSELDPESMPFDAKRMVYGGFRLLVSA